MYNKNTEVKTHKKIYIYNRTQRKGKERERKVSKLHPLRGQRLVTDVATEQRFPSILKWNIVEAGAVQNQKCLLPNVAPGGGLDLQECPLLRHSSHQESPSR